MITEKKARGQNSDDLRRRAEKIIRGKAARTPENPDALTPEETSRLLHELHVHQTELTMQNEELRRAQVELDAARARYFDLYDLAPVGYCTLSEKGLILDANLTAATLLGVARGALVKQPISRFILKEDQEIYYLHHKRLFETGEPQACELRMVKMDGLAFWAHLEASAAQDANGEPVFRIVMSDNPEHKRAAEALHREKENFRHSLDESPLGARIVTIEGETLYANCAFLDIYGYDSIEELKATPVKNRYTPKSYAEFLIRREKRQQGIETSSEYTVEIIRKNGGVRYLQVFRKTILWDGERQFQTIYNDITERKQAEEALATESHQLEETNAALRVLLQCVKEDQRIIEKRITTNIRKLVLPNLEKLRGLNLNDVQANCLETVTANLQQVTSPFLQNLAACFAAFTPREIQVAHMIREGKTSKEIADTFNTSVGNVDFHRDNIRKKLGLSHKKSNLRTFLLKLSEK